MSRARAAAGLVLATGILACDVDAARADVTIQEHIVVEGSGLMSMAGMSGTSTTSISGKRARIENDMRMQSGFARVLVRGAGQNSEIVQLDADTIYELDMKKKRYRRSSLAARRDQLAKSIEQTGQAQRANPIAFDDSQCDWLEPKATVLRTGAKATIAGLNAEPLGVVVRQSCRDRRSGEVCDIALSVEEWVASGSAGGREALQFRTAYAQQMGISNQGREVVGRAEAMFGRYRQAWSLVANELRDVKGFPVRTNISFGLGGASCKSAAGRASGAGGASALSPGALTGRLAGLFGRKKSSEQAPATAAPAGLSDMTVPLRLTSELISIGGEHLGADTFEVPAGFKNVTQ